MAAQLARFDSRLSVRVGRPDSGAEAMPQILSSDFVIRSVMSVVRTDSREFFMQPQSGILRAQLARKTRSEEHTSELQSLMRISYAVFCLKKKKNKKKIKTIQQKKEDIETIEYEKEEQKPIYNNEEKKTVK